MKRKAPTPAITCTMRCCSDEGCLAQSDQLSRIAFMNRLPKVTPKLKHSAPTEVLVTSLPLRPQIPACLAPAHPTRNRPLPSSKTTHFSAPSLSFLTLFPLRHAFAHDFSSVSYSIRKNRAFLPLKHNPFCAFQLVYFLSLKYNIFGIFCPFDGKMEPKVFTP